MAQQHKIHNQAIDRLRWPLRLTWLGIAAERAALAFWPLMTIILVVLALLMFGLHLMVPLELAWAGLVAVALAGLLALGLGVRKFRWPTRALALARIDENLPGHPIAAILDTQAIGASDDASRQVWNAHVDRMTARAAAAKAVGANIQTAKRDPYALRYVAMLAFVMALVFGSVWRLTGLDDLAGGNAALGPTASWEGWVEPPAFTGKPAIYLPDIVAGELSVPVGSRLTLRLYGDVGDLTVVETVSARTDGIGSVAEANQSFEIAQSGTLKIDGPSGRSWEITAIADMVPEIQLAGEIERSVRGEMKVPFSASDDYGVQTGEIKITLDLPNIPRRFGLVAEPEPRDTIIVDLPMPFRGDRRQVNELLVENLAEHPWAGLPVRMELSAGDATGQVGVSENMPVTMPGRRFFDPLAAALVEQRRYLLWSRDNAVAVAQVLRAVSNHAEDIFPSGADYLKLRVAVRRLEAGAADGDVASELQTEIAAALWQMALTIEDGDLADARARLKRAQDRLEQAMRDGATDDEIAELMQELNDAMQDYLRLLAEEQGNDPNNQTSQNQDGEDITNQQLQDMLDEIQDLMEQGRMAEAQQLMEELRQLMENMQVTQGEGGEGGPGQQSMNDLAETLREQEGLSDETFQDLQEQFGEEGEEPGNDGEDGPQGENGQQGQQGEDGQSGEPGQGGTGGNQGRLPGQNGTQGGGQQQGDGQGSGSGNSPATGLAQRQQALRDQLSQQSRNLPGGTGQGGGDARDALRRAEEAMKGAENSLRQEDYAGALDEQGRALEAMRDGMRDLAQDMEQQQNQQTGQQGEGFGRSTAESNRDPLGRDAGAAGRIGSDQRLLQGQDVYRRAQELLDEIRRRSSEQKRPEVELDYLRRLLDRF